MAAARRYLSGSWRSLCSAFTLDPTGEKFAFARFHSDEVGGAAPESFHLEGKAAATELSELHQNNGSAGKTDGCASPREKLGDELWITSGGTGEEKAHEYTDGHGSSADGKDKRNRISTWQAGWNVTNAIQGMSIVSFPYTVLQGGYWALVSMVVVAYVCCYTGKILVECLYDDEPLLDTDDDPTAAAAAAADGCVDQRSYPAAAANAKCTVRQRVRNSYVGIAEAVWGRRLGGRLVFVAQMIELLMTCILYVLLCGELMIGILPACPLDLTAWILVSGIVLLPCAFLRSLRHVAWLSFWCTVAHMVINGIIIVYCFTRVADWRWDAVQIRIDIWTFPISLGIVIFSYTSQIFLPSIEANLVDRSQFDTMLNWTHLAAAVFKAGFSYIGFVTFGNDTQEFISNNLPDQTMKIIVNLCLIAKALLSYPLPYFAAAELFETAFFRGRPETFFPPCYDSSSDSGTLKLWALTMRLGLVLVTMLMAIFVPHFAILMGLIGSVTGNMLSLVWPAYFHLRIMGASIGFVRRTLDVIIVMFGLVCSGLGLYYSSHALVRAFQGNKPRPFQTH